MTSNDDELEAALEDAANWSRAAAQEHERAERLEAELERLRPRADEWHMLKVENDMLKHRLKQLEHVQ